VATGGLLVQLNLKILIDRSIFHELPTDDLPVEQAAQFVEFEDDFDLLETHLIPHQHLAADEIGPALFVIFLAGLIIDVDLSVDDLSAAVALDGKDMERSLVGWSRCEKFLKEVHCRSP
jgi:hypothetical protein